MQIWEQKRNTFIHDCSAPKNYFKKQNLGMQYIRKDIQNIHICNYIIHIPL